MTTASAIGSRVNVNASSGRAACITPSPSEDTVCAVHSRPNPAGSFLTSEVFAVGGVRRVMGAGFPIFGGVGTDQDLPCCHGCYDNRGLS
ncbi:hypothetical protein Cci01nite_62060 [Catellatospora citrea]|uniref:Uncharacterized protein n=1 Tax=Catellatospora citrea TaxID=53366 RepID=A0A8J3P2E0_9ACTN|nr:hypothetical protein Cci01nite_62060 [Catellatospora citrea]